MKITNGLYVVLIVLTGFAVTSCYIEPVQDANQAQMITIDLQSQAALGYAGPGYYIRAHLYESSDVDSMMNSQVLIVDDVFKEISYDPAALVTPVVTEAYFIGAQVPPSGVVVLVNLAPGSEYRILLEIIYFSAVLTPPYYPEYNDGVGLSEVFSVRSGENTIITVEQYTYPLSG